VQFNFNSVSYYDDSHIKKFVFCKRGQFVTGLSMFVSKFIRFFCVRDCDIYFVTTELHGLTQRSFVNLTLISLKSTLS